jgi:N-acetylglutamate synthase-like GNAT family acetyltransferase
LTEAKIDTLYGLDYFVLDMKKIIIRKASAGDISAISRITQRHKEVMLFRSPRKIREILGNYFVALSKKEEVVGCCGFKIYPGGDAEIISLAVEKKYRGFGLGSRLIQKTIREARCRKSVRQIMVFANPSALPLFRKNRFIEAGVQLFHEKILEECWNCPRNQIKKGRYQCNETALVYIGKKK